MSPAADSSTDNEHESWSAVVRRDPVADGRFFYSVATTGVYCRPSCPSRLARRANVRFHASCAEAEAAGFRPCRRCRPNEASLSERRSSAVATACRLMTESDAPLDIRALAEAAGMSRFHFQRVFKATTGLTPGAYGVAHRAARVRADLPGSPSVTQAIYNAGFGSSASFYAKSSEWLGMRPSDYRSGAAGACIRFAVSTCALGRLLVAASERGICAILLDDDPDLLVRDLLKRFPRANLSAADAAFESSVAAVVRFVEAPRLGLNLPLDIRGTVFQARVWQALREIPPGSTTSYTDVARRIGAPKSARAVAQACAANALAVAIPCHRVVGRGGALSGYRWGIARKRALLDREA